VSHFSGILKGKRDINATIALKFEKALDFRAEFWVQLQAEYDLKLERQRLHQAKMI
jgi:antitoxin HigA-1